MKPQYAKHVLTFADFLLRLVLISAIVLTISSVIGYRIVTKEGEQQADMDHRVVTMEFKKISWITRIRSYGSDVIALALTIAIAIFELYRSWIILIIIISGLGWVWDYTNNNNNNSCRYQLRKHCLQRQQQSQPDF